MDIQHEKSFEKFYVKEKMLGEGMHATVFKCFKISDT